MRLRLPWRRSSAADEMAAGQRIEAHVAAAVPFDERGPYLARAVAHYLAAAELSRAGSAAWREGMYQAGCLLAGENSVRDLDRAVLLLEAVIGSVDGYHPAYYYLGEALIMRKEFDRAEVLLRRALELDPGQASIRDVLENLPIDRVHEAAKRGDAAVLPQVERIPEAERSAEAWVLYGDALASFGRSDEAAGAWRRAMALEPLKGMRRRFRGIGRAFPGDA